MQVLEQTSIAESRQVHETFPACAYAALELCERHLAALKSQLKQVGRHSALMLYLPSLTSYPNSVSVDPVCKALIVLCADRALWSDLLCFKTRPLAQVPGHRQRPQKKIAPSKGRSRGPPSAARPLQTRQRSGLGPAKSGLERCSSYSKRRRNEYDMADILMSDARYVERPKVCLPSCVLSASLRFCGFCIIFKLLMMRRGANVLL